MDYLNTPSPRGFLNGRAVEWDGADGFYTPRPVKGLRQRVGERATAWAGTAAGATRGAAVQGYTATHTVGGATWWLVLFGLSIALIHASAKTKNCALVVAGGGQNTAADETTCNYNKSLQFGVGVTTLVVCSLRFLVAMLARSGSSSAPRAAPPTNYYNTFDMFDPLMTNQ